MSWFPDILPLVVAPVIRIPLHKNLLTQLGQKFVRENVGSLKLHAWHLSADWSEIESFRQMLADTQLKQGVRLPDEFMMPNGKFFSDWWIQREAHPFWATPSEVADFLLHLFQEKKCQVSTIKGYRSTISNTLKFKSDNNIGSDPIISELIKSFELQRPVQRSLAPNGTFLVSFLHYVLNHMNHCIRPLGSISLWKPYFCLPWQQWDVLVRFMPSPWIQGIPDSISQMVLFL